jgi:uncharacterized repeat protein (TIGR03806 family)
MDTSVRSRSGCGIARITRTAAALLATSLLAACGDGADAPPATVLASNTDAPYATLSAGVLDHFVAYDVRNPLFTDNAIKARAIRVPTGLSGRYTSTGAFELPVGTIAMKSFGYPRDDGSTRWIETRLMVKQQAGWRGYAYQWNDAHTEATHVRGGAIVDVGGPGRPAAHVIPREDQCSACHGAGERMAPIGLRAEQLNRPITYGDGEQEQLVRWAALGLIRDVPPVAEIPRAASWKDPTTGTTAERARGYLDGNCAHCHNESGIAKGTDLFLGLHVASTRAPGECKPHGEGYDVVPGDPERSFLVHRLESTDAELVMPPIGRSLVDDEALVRSWIRALPGSCP